MSYMHIIYLCVSNKRYLFIHEHPEIYATPEHPLMSKIDVEGTSISQQTEEQGR